MSIDMRPINIGGLTPKILSREEELAAWHAGDREALVLSVWPLMVKLALRMADEQDAVFDDLLSAAHLVIARAFSTYNPGRGVRFVSYVGNMAELHMRSAFKSFFIRPAENLSEASAAELRVYDEPVVDQLAQAELLPIAQAALREACTEHEVRIVRDICDGQTFVQVASAICRKKQTVHHQYKAAIAKCRQAMGENAVA